MTSPNSRTYTPRHRRGMTPDPGKTPKFGKLLRMWRDLMENTTKTLAGLAALITAGTAVNIAIHTYYGDLVKKKDLAECVNMAMSEFASTHNWDEVVALGKLAKDDHEKIQEHERRLTRNEGVLDALIATRPKK